MEPGSDLRSHPSDSLRAPLRTRRIEVRVVPPLGFSVLGSSVVARDPGRRPTVLPRIHRRFRSVPLLRGWRALSAEGTRATFSRIALGATSVVPRMGCFLQVHLRRSAGEGKGKGTFGFPSPLRRVEVPTPQSSVRTFLDVGFRNGGSEVGAIGSGQTAKETTTGGGSRRWDGVEGEGTRARRPVVRFVSRSFRRSRAARRRCELDSSSCRR